MKAAPMQPGSATAAMTPDDVERIVLTGFMGAGKTTVGRLLAASLGWQFLDLDEHLEVRTGTTIAELFEQHGEQGFRRLESSALANALGRPRTVLALGGGVPEVLTNRLLLEQTPATRIVLLDGPFPVIYDRCMLQAIAQAGSVRPLLATPEGALERYTRRRPLYRRLAHHVLEVAESTPEQTAAALFDALAQPR